MNFKNLLIAVLVLIIGGCASTEKTEFTEDGLVDYIDLELLHTYETDLEKRSCKHLYKYDGLLVFNTGVRWGFYNPESGLFATGLRRTRMVSNKNQKPSVHYFIKKEGPCAKELKLPANRALEYQRVYIQDPLSSGDLKVQDAMDTVYSYNGENLLQDHLKELNIIGRKINNDSTYQSQSGFGEIVSRKSGQVTFESIARVLKNKKWTKRATLAKIHKEKEKYRKFIEQQSEFIKQLNSLGSLTWMGRTTSNQSLSRGDKICTFDNYYGFVEDIANDKVKIMWKGKIDRDDKGFFFGNISKNDGDRKVVGSINFKTLKVEDMTWASKVNLAKCPFEFN